MILYTEVDAFCEISCEGQIVKSEVIKQTSNPEWNYFAVFYRKNPVHKPIRVDVRISFLRLYVAVQKV